LIERKTIKVCHLTSAHKPDDVRIFHKECSSLASAGFTVFLVAANCEMKVVNGVQIVGVKAPVFGRYTRMLNTSRKVYEKALSLNADIYHFHDPELLPYGLKLKKKGKIVIYDAHEDVPKQILGKYWINKYLRKSVAAIFKKYEDNIAKRLDYILTATPFIRDRFKKINHLTTDINNYPLLSELSEETNWGKKKNEICYIGGISVIRGIGQLIDSMDDTEGFRLNLAGNFSPESLRAEIISKAAWGRVNEYGYVGRAETIKIMEESKVGVVTFLALPNHVDAQPNKMFEYMSAAIPVLGSNFPLWREIIEENNCGLCVDPEDPKAIAKALNTLLSDDGSAEQMGKNGRKAVIEKYNWTEEEKKLVRIYDELAKLKSLRK
jgi:glycosyltransferase involved in cell wall biosynthesis